MSDDSLEVRLFKGVVISRQAIGALGNAATVEKIAKLFREAFAEQGLRIVMADADVDVDAAKLATRLRDWRKGGEALLPLHLDAASALEQLRAERDASDRMCDAAVDHSTQRTMEDAIRAELGAAGVPLEQRVKVLESVIDALTADRFGNSPRSIVRGMISKAHQPGSS